MRILMRFILVILGLMLVLWLVLKLIVLVITYGLGLIIAALFWPRCNAILSFACILLLFYNTTIIGMRKIFLIIALIDCIVDWIIAPKVYKGDDGEEYYISIFYIIKSLISIFTGFYARAVYLLVVNPIIYIKTKKNVNDMLQNVGIIPNNYIITKHQECMYMVLNEYIKQGRVITNKEEVKDELEYSKVKLEDSYPTKFVDKLAEQLNTNNEIKEEREKAEREIKSEYKMYSYIGNQFYQHCKQEFDSVLVSHGTLSPVDIIKLEDLQSMVFLNGKKFANKEVILKYYAISILNGLEKDGIVEKYDFGDGLFENHQYKHTNGLPMKSINADENPLLALDDD